MKKIKQILSLLLCLIVCIGVPSTVYAKTISSSRVSVLIHTGLADNIPSVFENNVTIPHYFKNNYSQVKYQRYELDSDTFQLSEGDTIDVNIVLNYGNPCRYVSWQKSYFYVLTRTDDDAGWEYCITEHENALYDAETGTIHFTTTVKNVHGECYIQWFGDYPTLTSDSPSVTFSFGVTDYTIDVKSEQSGFFDKVSDFFQGLFDKLTAWFDSLFQWLKDIRDNASEGFSNIGNWFTELGNKIKGFFTELGNNIKEQFTNMINNLKSFFADVGQWFNDIGDRIGDFFTNLWNNITVTINGITDSVREWWQGIVDWFNSLFKVSDGYFEEYGGKWDEWFSAHFGIAYQAISLIDDIINSINNGLSKGNISVVTIPSLVFSVDGMPVLIARQSSINLESFYNQHSMLANLLTMMRMMSSAVIIICLVNYAHKFINNNVLQSEGDG